MHPASIATGAETLTWSSLTSDWELLYQWHGAVAVVVGVHDPPVRTLSKENPIKKQTRHLD